MGLSSARTLKMRERNQRRCQPDEDRRRRRLSRSQRIEGKDVQGLRRRPEARSIRRHQACLAAPIRRRTRHWSSQKRASHGSQPSRRKPRRCRKRGPRRCGLQVQAPGPMDQHFVRVVQRNYLPKPTTVRNPSARMNSVLHGPPAGGGGTRSK